MSDATTKLDLISSGQAQKEVTANAMFDAASPGMLFGRRASTTTGLTWGYYGGSILIAGTPTAIPNGTVALTASDRNYIEATTTGTVSKNLVGFTAGRIPLYTVDTYSAGVDDYTDHRDTGVTRTGTSGRHAIPIVAGSMSPSITGGCSTLTSTAMGAGKPDIYTLDFDPNSSESAQFCVPMPPSWNGGTVTFLPYWSHTSVGSPTLATVVWSLQGVAKGDGDSFSASFGTAVEHVDTGGSANTMYCNAGTTSGAVTIAGSPQAGDWVAFKINRVTADTNNTLDVDARLHGLLLFITTIAETDL